MSLAAGLLRIVYFSLTWGLFTAVNALLLNWAGGQPWKPLGLAGALILALFEALLLLELMHRARRRHRLRPDKQSPAEQDRPACQPR